MNTVRSLSIHIISRYTYLIITTYFIIKKISICQNQNVKYLTRHDIKAYLCKLERTMAYRM